MSDTKQRYFRIELVDEEDQVLGAMWHAIDVSNGDLISKSFGRSHLKAKVEALGYILYRCENDKQSEILL